MKNLYHILVLAGLMATGGLNTNTAAAFGAAGNDTIHTREYIGKISITEPHRALRLIDETEELRLMPPYRLDHLRSMVYQNGMNMYSHALTYSLRAYASDSIRRHPDEALRTLELITDQYNNTGNYTESIRYAIEGIGLARQTGNRASEANLLLYIAVNKRHMGLKKEAEPYLAHSVELLEEAAADSRDCQEVDDLIYLYGTIGTFAYDDGEYRKAIDLLPRYRKLMERFKACTGLPDGIYDMRLASIYALYSSVFAADGQMDKAEEYYRKFDATEYARTDDGNQMRFDYLLATGRYREALQFIHADKENYRAQGDTVNHYYVGRTLAFEAKAHIGLGDYKAAARAYKQMYDLSDSLHVREKRNGVLEYAAIYKTQEKEAQIAEQTARLRESRMMVLFAGCLAVLLGVLLWRIVHHFRIIKRKNVVMVHIIREQLAYKDELFLRKEEIRSLREELRQKTEEMNRAEASLQEKETSLPKMQGQQMTQAEARQEMKPEAQAGMQPGEMQPENRTDGTLPKMPEEALEETPEEVSAGTSTGASVRATEVSAGTPAAGNLSVEEYTDAAMQRMFARANREIISRKLYLQPDFSREELKETVNIPHNRFAGLFKKYTGMSFSKYINKLRLEYAARLLEEYPEYSIEAIAGKCGISSTTTFYRLFSESFGMTPKEFRAGAKHTED